MVEPINNKVSGWMIKAMSGNSPKTPNSWGKCRAIPSNMVMGNTNAHKPSGDRFVQSLCLPVNS